MLLSNFRSADFTTNNDSQLFVDSLLDAHADMNGVDIAPYLDPALYDVLKAPGYAAVAITLYALVIVVGVVGNVLVVLTLGFNQQPTTATDVFIGSLAIVDIAVCTLDLPLLLYYQLTDYWILGRVMCHVMPIVLTVVAYGSTLTLVMIAIDRYILIVYPMRPRITQRRAFLWLVITYLVVMIVVAPVGVFSAYTEYHQPMLNIHRVYCIEQWPSHTYRVIYSVFTFATHFALPLVLISVLYVRIFKRLQSRLLQRRRTQQQKQKAKAGQQQGNLATRMMKNAALRGNSPTNQTIAKDEASTASTLTTNGNSETVAVYKSGRTAKMLAAVVLVFAVFWTPYHIFVIIAEINYDLVKGKYFKFTDVMLRGFAISSACVNPFLYGWFNEIYRTSFFAMISRVAAAFRPEPQGINDLNVNTFKILTATMTRLHQSKQQQQQRPPTSSVVTRGMSTDYTSVTVTDVPDERTPLRFNRSQCSPGRARSFSIGKEQLSSTANSSPGTLTEAGTAVLGSSGLTSGGSRLSSGLSVLSPSIPPSPPASGMTTSSPSPSRIFAGGGAGGGGSGMVSPLASETSRLLGHSNRMGSVSYTRESSTKTPP